MRASSHGATCNLMSDELASQLLSQASHAYWLHALRPHLRVDGDPLNFHDYPYAPDLIDDEHPNQVIIKGAQLGFTIALTLRTIARLARRHGLHKNFSPRGALYLLPTERDVSDFSKARFARIVRDNPVLAEFIHDTDAVNIKRVGHGFIYFRGATVPSALKTIPVDDLILDERDEMDDDMVELAQHRLDSSLHPRRSELSTPTVPEYGVDLAFASSDQMVWKIKCSHCNHWTCLELNWPDSLRELKDGRVIRACGKCHDEIFPHDGQWVATFPDRTERRGRWVSQLNSSRLNPREILRAYESALGRGKQKEFMNSRLGMAYADLDDALTTAIILDACDPDAQKELVDEGPCAMGVDPGKRDFHWVVGKRVSDTRRHVLNYGVCHTEQQVLDRLDRFNVKYCVIDEMAETRTVRRMKERRPGRIYGCWYVEGKRGDYDWDDRELRVTVNRTESLDDSHFRLVNKMTTLPRVDDQTHELLIPQLKNLARVVREEKDTKKIRVLWVVRGGVKNDHLRHAYNYFEMAAQRVGVAAVVRRARRRTAERTGHRGRARGTWMSG